jgi:hypothetical protein
MSACASTWSVDTVRRRAYSEFIWGVGYIRRGNVMKRGTILFASIVGVLVSASVAVAGTGSSATGYGGAAGAVQSQVSQASKGAVKGSTLPFTGLNLGLVVAGALTLFAVGFAMRRISRGKS